MTITVSESIALALQLRASVFDAVAVAEVSPVSRSIALQVSVNDLVLIGDGVSPNFFSDVSVSEFAAILLTRLTVNAFDNVSAAGPNEFAAVFLTKLKVNVSDSVTAGEFATWIDQGITRQINVSDAVSAGEFTDRRVSRLFANVSDSVSVTESNSIFISATFNPAWTLSSNQLI